MMKKFNFLISLSHWRLQIKTLRKRHQRYRLLKYPFGRTTHWVQSAPWSMTEASMTSMLYFRMHIYIPYILIQKKQPSMVSACNCTASKAGSTCGLLIQISRNFTFYRYWNYRSILCSKGSLYFDNIIRANHFFIAKKT